MGLDEFIGSLAEDLPGDVLAYHRDRAGMCIPGDDRKSYARAAPRGEGQAALR